jgi:biopolymer transport protein ExbD
MPRRREDHQKDHFDLLPFIAILMCVLGCLLLVTMSIAALSIGPGVGEGWVPTRDRQTASKKPILIEWDGTTAIAHYEGRKLKLKWSKPSRIRLGDSWFALKEDSNADREELNKFLDDVAELNQTHYALFAVRPSGFGNFFQFADEFRNRKIDIGYEPIQQEKPVRLLREKKQP